MIKNEGYESSEDENENIENELLCKGINVNALSNDLAIVKLDPQHSKSKACVTTNQPEIKCDEEILYYIFEEQCSVKGCILSKYYCLHSTNEMGVFGELNVGKIFIDDIINKCPFLKPLYDEDKKNLLYILNEFIPYNHTIYYCNNFIMVHKFSELDMRTITCMLERIMITYKSVEGIFPPVGELKYLDSLAMSFFEEFVSKDDLPLVFDITPLDKDNDEEIQYIFEVSNSDGNISITRH